MSDLNPRPTDSKSDDLPTELTGHTVTMWKHLYLTVKVKS